jgi:predicted ATP-dependent protease
MGVAHTPSGRVAKAREQVLKPLSPDQLVRHWDPAALPFETTAELPDVAEYFGQTRAVEAVSFGLGMHREGFNLYVMGPPGIGKQSLVRHCLAAEVAARPAPADWCYVMNFADARKPRALALPAGRAVRLQRAMAAFVDELRTAIPAIFESDEYRARRAQIGRTHTEREQASLRALNREFTRYAASPLVEEVKAGFRDLPQVIAYLDEVGADVVENADLFLKTGPAGPLPGLAADPGAAMRRYRVNVMVDHGASQGPPVVFPDPCGLADLVGRVEHVAQLGALVTDFTLIRAGAVHRANGGYLLLDAFKVLTQPYAWEALKRCLRSGEIRIDPPEGSGPVSIVSIEPEPVPLEAKVVLFGDRLLYYLLHEYDPDFRELFKVQVDFSDRLPWGPEGADFYARVTATVCRRDGLLPFDRGAVARIVDHGARAGEDSEKLSAHMQDLADLLREADYWARAAGKTVTDRAEVERAIAARVRRADRLRDEVHDAILRNVLCIDSTGARVGQVNGLSVLRLGDFEFAEPTRITATVRLGEGDVVDIQREVDMGGALHAKGVMILASFLGARFAKTAPLSLAASLVFEQTYEPVEGDSASLAELCALLSALAEVPVRQSFAVTGSVDQHGHVQAIGAVNEKIEGFFDLCAKRGLTAEQGVLIPASNVTHLMLREDVVDAVRAGRFAVYAVATVDEAIELLTGLPAGAPDARGVMAEDGINSRVQMRLHEFSLIRREYGRRGKHRFPRHHD